MAGPLKLARLPVNWQNQPQLFERYWDESMSKIENTVNSLLLLPLIQDALDAVDAAVIVAQDAADNANIAAENVSSNTSLTNSYPSAVGTIVTASSTGDITIATHDRVYGDTVLNPTVSVTGDTITTTAIAGDIVRVYYNDATRAGGAVTYLYTIDPAAAPVQTGNVHSVGAVEIPAAGSQGGSPVRPPGYAEL